MTEILTAFGAVFLAELPDKTMVATLLLTARSRRPLAVWLGVSVAFGCHVLLAVLAGSLVSRLPEWVVALVAAIIFAIGGWSLLRPDKAVEAVGDDLADTVRRPPWSVVGLSFATVLVAEFGDLTQLATAGLAANARHPWQVGVGAALALSSVAALAAGVGETLARRVPFSTVRRIGGLVFLVLSVLALIKAGTAL